MKKILLIDNYDSFVYNIVHLVKSATGHELEICCNDLIPFSRLNEFSHIILSPGPGLPSEAGDLLKVIDMCKETHSILGVCLGHQAIACCFGGKLMNLSNPLHGHKSLLELVDTSDPILGRIYDENGCFPAIEVGLYHSWAVDANSLPEDLCVGSVNEHGIPMSLFHKTLKIYGVQFHPESVISEYGVNIMSNWMLL